MTLKQASLSPEAFAGVVGNARQVFLYATLHKPDRFYAAAWDDLFDVASDVKLAFRVETSTQVRAASLAGWLHNPQPLEVLFKEPKELVSRWRAIQVCLAAESLMVLIDNQKGDYFSGRMTALGGYEPITWVATTAFSQGKVIIPDFLSEYGEAARPFVHSALSLLRTPVAV